MLQALNSAEFHQRFAELERLVKAQHERIAELESKVVDLKEQLAQRDARIDELETKLARNSSNSSKPPSSDSPNFERNQSRRKTTKRKPGGQKGHDGSTLAMVDAPDETVQHTPPALCPGCGTITSSAELTIASRHQVFDIPPPPPPVVTEHQIMQCNCPGCGAKLRGQLPEAVASSPTSYGLRIAGFVSYFSVRHYLPYKRLAELVSDVFGVKVSTGTIANMIERTARRFIPTVQAIKAAVGQSTAIGSDETFVREAGRKINIWVWCTRYFTYLARGPGRGFDVIEREWPEGLPHATLISDRLAAQLKTPSHKKQVCLHHLLRECYGLAQRKDATSWIEALIDVLLRIVRAGPYGRRCYRQTFEFIEADLAELLDQKYYGMLSAKEEDFHVALRRVHPYLTPCLYSREVSPDNDECERDIRGFKVKVNVSGQWRSAKGTKNYCTIRSVIATALKQALRPIEVLLEEQQIAIGHTG